MLYRFPILALCLFLNACSNKPFEPDNPAEPPEKEKIDILALGDSYTKGEGIPFGTNFPNQIVDSLRARGYDVTGLRVIAQTGWRTDQLQTVVNQNHPDIQDSTFSLVTLCIGVNNQYQGRPLDEFKIQFEQLLETALARAGGRRERVMVLSIPDYAYTPFGQTRPNAAQISAQIDAFNAAKRQITEARGIAWIEVTDISRQGLVTPNLVASDGLHPSAKQYAEWVRRIVEVWD
jgi:acyl-CoA thioesterase-1